MTDRTGGPCPFPALGRRACGRRLIGPTRPESGQTGPGRTPHSVQGIFLSGQGPEGPKG